MSGSRPESDMDAPNDDKDSSIISRGAADDFQNMAQGSDTDVANVNEHSNEQHSE